MHPKAEQSPAEAARHHQAMQQYIWPHRHQQAQQEGLAPPEALELQLEHRKMTIKKIQKTETQRESENQLRGGTLSMKRISGR